MVCHAAESQGAEHAARARELCILRVVGLAVLGADYVFHPGGLPRRFADRRSARETRQKCFTASLDFFVDDKLPLLFFRKHNLNNVKIIKRNDFDGLLSQRIRGLKIPNDCILFSVFPKTGREQKNN